MKVPTFGLANLKEELNQQRSFSHEVINKKTYSKEGNVYNKEGNNYNKEGNRY